MNIYVTDHALVRYMERVKGIDLDAVRREILTPERVAMIKAGAVRIKIEGGNELRIKESAVVTIVNRGHRWKKGAMDN